MTPQQNLSLLREHIKQIKAEKNKLAAQFKHAKDDPATLEHLKNSMRQISSELKAREQERKAAEAQLEEPRASESSNEKESPPFPPRFGQAPLNADYSSVSINELDGSAAAEWDDYVNSNPRASLYHLYCWRQVIEDAFGHRCHYYVARDSRGRICGVLPLVSIQSRLFGHYAVSMPFFNYGGPLADSQAIANRLLDAARGDASRQGWQHLEHRTCDSTLELPSNSRKVSMIRQLPNKQSVLDDSLGAKVRAQYKQTEQHQPAVKFGGAELLDDFYLIFSRAMRDLGTPVYSRWFFDAILRQVDLRATIVCVYMDQRPAAAAFLLGFRDMLEIPWAATLRKYNSCNVNMWMYRKILGFAVDGGYDYFDFGRSTMDAGTYRFKKQWGAKPVKHYWYYQFPDQPSGSNEEQTLPALNPDNPKYRLAIASWKYLPLFVANAVGPHIVKNLP